MKFLQFAFVLATTTVALAQVVPYPVIPGTDSEVNSHPSYSFEYSVADPVTGDQKSQQESRDGDKVQGFYTVVESDGSLRKVEYYADAVSGFTATVSHQPGGPAPPAPASYQTYKPEVAAPVKVVPAPSPIPPAPIAPVKVPAQQYYNGYKNPGYQGYYNQGYNNPGYYQGGYYQNPQAYYQNSGYYQGGYYQNPQPYYQNSGYYQGGYYPQAYYQQGPYQQGPAYYSGARPGVNGFFSSPSPNYALPGSTPASVASVATDSKESKK